MNGMTKAELIARARTSGHRITSDQFRRWRDHGLLPAPVFTGRGRAKGREARYPEVVGSQLVAIAKALSRDRDLNTALWRLWWEGWPFDETRILALLRDSLEQIGHERAAIQFIEDSDEAASTFERQIGGRLFDRGLARVRRRLGKAKYASLVMILRTVATGMYHGVDSVDERLILCAFGLIDKKELRTAPLGPASGFLRKISGHMNGALLSTSLDESGLMNLLEARDSFRLAVRTFKAVVNEATTATHVGSFLIDLLKPAADEFVDLPPRYLFLAWLGIRRHERFAEVFSALMPIVDRFAADRLSPSDEISSSTMPSVNTARSEL